MVETDRRKLRFQWKAHRLIWNLSGGRLGRKLLGMPVLELVTTGHKSGQERKILIFYVGSENAPLIVGTNGGAAYDPAWVKNLRANPEAQARWNGKWRDVYAVELTGNDHEEAWQTAVAASETYLVYEKTATRHVPIYRLDPAS
ncbi:MAG: nitroreductase/quinone reductase family protein [Acidimicrobiia bacterium]|nr:nitroreductase/quinone reductase family protein [Acidimicrobiia bacterium]